MMNALINMYFDIVQNKSDRRVKDWPLMSSPFPILILWLTYFYVVTVAGPKFMKNRRPLNLKYILIFYNLFQVIFNAYIFYEIGMSGWLTHYSYRCQLIDNSEDPHTMRMVKICWWYLILKLVDFGDTIFFVLRKKNNQLTVLHIYHHFIAPPSVWIGVKFAPSGHGTFFGFLNTFVHMLMYTYYLIAACGKRYQKYLWWKKYITALQMTQFCLMGIHALQLFFIECDYPKIFSYIVIYHAISFFYLFYKFYMVTYTQKRNNVEMKTAEMRGFKSGNLDAENNLKKRIITST